MAGPWEKYQAEAGPWDKYKSTEDAIQSTKFGPVFDAVAGAVRGAGSIGTTLLYPIDAAARALGVENSWIGRSDRRTAMDEGLGSLGADTSSFAFKGGKLGGEIAGTAGVGGALANVARAANAAPSVVNALASGGFMTGGKGASDFALRAGAGAVTGGSMAGLVDPQDALAGAAIGGVAPGVVGAAGKVGTFIGDKMRSGSEGLMWSALKPTQRARESGDAAVAVRELLDRGINPTNRGVREIRELKNAVDRDVTQAIANSPVRINRDKAISAVDSARQKFGSQVSPTADLSAIDSVVKDFVTTNPRPTLSVQDAQAIKQGTYRVLDGKYGQLGSAETEAQKAIARGLKDEISKAVPGVAAKNEEWSRLIKTLDVAERRALLEANKNPFGLAALAVHQPGAFAAFMADRSALFKSLLARTLNQAGGGTTTLSGGLLGLGEKPLIRAGLLEASLATQP